MSRFSCAQADEKDAFFRTMLIKFFSSLIFTPVRLWRECKFWFYPVKFVHAYNYNYVFFYYYEVDYAISVKDALLYNRVWPFLYAN